MAIGKREAIRAIVITGWVIIDSSSRPAFEAAHRQNAAGDAVRMFHHKNPQLARLWINDVRGLVVNAVGRIGKRSFGMANRCAHGKAPNSWKFLAGFLRAPIRWTLINIDRVVVGKEM